MSLETKTLTRRDFFRTVLILLIGGILSYVGLKRFTPAFGTVSTTSYTIRTDGTTIYARNDVSGADDYSGTDATTIINSAINALTNGGKILITGGIYIITASITVKSNISLEGIGFATILQAKNALNTHVIQSDPSGSVNIKISNLKIDGNGINQTGGSSNGIMLGGGTSKHALIKNCFITSVYANAILVGGYNYTNIEDNIIDGCLGHGIYYQYANSNAIITGNQISNIGSRGSIGFGIGINSTNGINSKFVISNNIMYNTGLEGINISALINVIYEVSITNNMIDSSGDGGITLLGTILTDVSCCANQCYNNANSGIGLSTTNNVIVIGNVCKNNNQSKQSFSGIDVANSVHCIVTNNRCYDTQTNPTQNYGISEWGNSSDNIIEQNMVHYNKNGSLYRAS